MHWIRTYILEQLLTTQKLRNRDLRPNKVESNLFQYHLNQLVADKYVEKGAGGYTLATKGLAWADKYSGALKKERQQPKMVTIIGLQNDKGQYLLLRKPRQPFVNTFHLPSGKLHMGESVVESAEREAREKLGIEDCNPNYVGWARITIASGTQPITEYIGFLFKVGAQRGYVPPKDSEWYSASDAIQVMPGVVDIITCFEQTQQYFEKTIQL